MSTLPLRTLPPCNKLSPLFRSNCGLSTLHSHPSFPLSPSLATLTSYAQLTENKTTLSLFPATLTKDVKHKSFVCHSYRKQEGLGVPHIAFQIRPSTFNFQLSTLDIRRPPRVTSYLL